MGVGVGSPGSCPPETPHPGRGEQLHRSASSSKPPWLRQGCPLCSGKEEVNAKVPTSHHITAEAPAQWLSRSCPPCCSLPQRS